MSITDTDAESGACHLRTSSTPSADIKQPNKPPPQVHSYGTVDNPPTNPDGPNESSEQNISPPDKGRAAWLFLIGCFWLEGLVWAFPLSFGVFEDYYSQHERFAGQAGIPAIGTTELGTSYFLAFPVVWGLQKWPRQRRNASVLGLLVMTASLVGASCATAVNHLVWTQGLLYGVGGSLLYNPFIFYLDEWFVKRKGLAYGVAWAGTSFGGSIIPFLMEWGLHTYGFQSTLRAWALFVFITLSFLVYLLGPRVPPSDDDRSASSVDLSFFTMRLFWIFQAANVIQGLGYFLPTIYLPSFAKSVGFSSLTATLSVSVLNFASTVGLILMGALVDRFPLSRVFLISAFGSAISVFLFWGLVVEEFAIYLFALCYGLFAGGFVATWARCATEIQKEQPRAEVAVLICVFAAGKGVGAMISGPLSENLRKLDRWGGGLGGAYATSYGVLIIFAGVSAVLSGIGFFGRPRLRHWPDTPPKGPAAERDPLIQ